MKKTLLTIGVVLNVIIMILFFIGCNTKESKCIFCPLHEGSVIASIKDNQIKWEMDEKIRKADALQLALQVYKLLPKFPFSDTLIYKNSEIINDNGFFYWVSYFSLGGDKSFTLSMDLKNENNQLLLSAKEVNGCIGNSCSYCKFIKGKGCACSAQEGKCEHIVIDLSLPLPF